MTAAPIRKEIVLAPGEAVRRTASWDAELFPSGTSRLDGVASAVELNRGQGTLEVSALAASGDSLDASWLAELSADALPGSVFSVTLTASVGDIRAKVAERVVVVG